MNDVQKFEVYSRSDGDVVGFKAGGRDPMTLDAARRVARAELSMGRQPTIVEVAR
jgi:hypothetical protein